MFQQKPLKSQRRGRGGGEAAFPAGLLLICFLVLEKIKELTSSSKSSPCSSTAVFCDELVGGTSSMSSGGVSLRLRILGAFTSNDLRRLGREEDCGRLCIEQGTTSVQSGLLRQKTEGSWRVRFASVARPSRNQEALLFAAMRLETVFGASPGTPAGDEENVASGGELTKRRLEATQRLRSCCSFSLA